LRVAIDSFVSPGYAGELYTRLSSEARNSAARLAEIGNAVIDELTENNDFHSRPADPLLDRELDPRIPMPEDVHAALDTFPDAIALMAFFDGSMVVYDDPVNPLDMLHFLWPRLSRILAVHMATVMPVVLVASLKPSVLKRQNNRFGASFTPPHARSNDYRLAPEFQPNIGSNRSCWVFSLRPGRAYLPTA
jgi:hypothetical protein